MTQINRENAPTGDQVRVRLKDLLGRFPRLQMVFSSLLGDDFKKFLRDQGYQVDTTVVQQPTPDKPIARHQ